jgi:5'-3' exonuclease
LYKTLLGDASDKIAGIKGLGQKGIFKKFPELSKNVHLTMDDIFDISEAKLKEHVVYARIIQDFDRLETNYKLMNLDNPLLSDEDKELLEEVSKTSHLSFEP